MKWFLLILLLVNNTLLYGQNRLLSKKLSMELDNASLEEILNEITRQSGVHFAFNSRLIQPEKQITVSASNETLEYILEKLCHDFNLEYKVVRRQVILKEAPEKDEPVKYFTISGIVRDKETGETLPGATVWAQNTTSGTISNNYGFFSLSLPKDMYSLQFRYVGFRPETIEVSLETNKRMDIGMELNTEILGEVNVVVNEQLDQIQKSQMSNIVVNPRSMQEMPEFAGEIGLIKSLQSFPGIKTHSDGSAFFFVRGGNKDQNLILIDEAPVYNPAHLFGYYSVIIPDVAKDISIYKGDMPIEKGDRLSSVIDVQTKDGNLNRFGFNGALNPLISRISLEGPVVREKCSFFTSLRRSNFDWIYKEAYPNSDLYMSDFNFKINWKINPDNRIYFSFFRGRDNYTGNDQNARAGIQWRNTTATLRWNHVFNSRLFSNTTLYGSTYNYNLLAGPILWVSEIRNLSLTYDMSYYKSPELTYKFGFSRTGHDFNPGNLANMEDFDFIPRVSAGTSSQTTLYISREQMINDRWSWKAGLRMPVWRHKGPAVVYSFDQNYQVVDTLIFQGEETIKRYLDISPRISARYRISDDASLKFSYGIYHQYLHLLTNSMSPFSSFEIWMPSGTNIKPQRSNQLGAGFTQYFPKSKLEFTSELYFKKMHNQIEYQSHSNLLLNPLVEGQLRFGTARSYGLELMLRRTEGRFTGWMSYTWSRVFNRIDEINNGLEYPAFYDRPHDFSVFISYNLRRRLNLSANWTYYTGSAITTPVAFYEYNGSKVPFYGAKNNDRLPDYHRLDISMNWMLNKPGNKFEHSLNFGIYNLYNRHNPVSVNFNKVKTQNGNFVVPANLYGTHEIMTTQRYILGIMPSITYKFGI